VPLPLPKSLKPADLRKRFRFAVVDSLVDSDGSRCVWGVFVERASAEAFLSECTAVAGKQIAVLIDLPDPGGRVARGAPWLRIKVSAY